MQDADIKSVVDEAFQIWYGSTSEKARNPPFVELANLHAKTKYRLNSLTARQPLPDEDGARTYLGRLATFLGGEVEDVESARAFERHGKELLAISHTGRRKCTRAK